MKRLSNIITLSFVVVALAACGDESTGGEVPPTNPAMGGMVNEGGTPSSPAPSNPMDPADALGGTPTNPGEMDSPDPDPGEPPTPEQPMPEDPAPEDPDPEEPMPEEPMPEEPMPEEPMPEEPMPEEPMPEEPMPEEPMPEEPMPEEPMPEEPMPEEPMPEDPAPEANVLNEAEQRFLDTLIERTAASTCDAVSTCCSDGEVEAFFGPMATHPLLEAFADRLPPNAALDPETCPETIAAVYDVVPLGDWIRSARAGRVAFDLEAAMDCMDALEGVVCDASFHEAFFGGQCFGFTAPFGEGGSRTAFSRVGEAGDPCVGLSDGSGGAFFGTCNPDRTWCARSVEGRTQIVGPENEGRCVPVALVGQPCGFILAPNTPPSLQVCQTGLECDIDNQCAVPNNVQLPAGDPCYDADAFSLLGRCENSFCDMLGTNLCVALKEQGAECSSGFECASEFCEEGVCRAGQFCDGEG